VMLSTTSGSTDGVGSTELRSDLRILWIKFEDIRWSFSLKGATRNPSYKKAIQVPQNEKIFRTPTD